MTLSLITLSAVIEPFQELNDRPPCNEMAGQQKLHTHLLKPQQTCLNKTLTNIRAVHDSWNENNITISFPNNIQQQLNDSRKYNITNCIRLKEKRENVSVNLPSPVKYTCLLALMMFVIGYALGYGPSK